MANIVPAGGSGKSFWDKPEGKTGLLFIGIGVIALLFFGNVIAPFLIAALQNTLHAMVLGGIVLAIVTLAMNQKFRFLIGNMFKSIMRFITGMFITIDPIGILKNYIEVMEKKIQGIENNILKLTGQKRNIYENIQRSREEAENHMRMASAAKNQGKNEEAVLYARKGARAKESADNFEVIHKKMELLYNVLDRMKKSVNFLLEDTKDEVRVKEIEYKSIKAAHKAMSSAQDLINGSSERELFEQSMEHLATDIGQKLGEMDRFMDLSEQFMSGVDIQNGAWDEKGLEMLTAWENESTLIDYADKKALPQASPSANSMLQGNSQAATVAAKSNSFDSLFK